MNSEIEKNKRKFLRVLHEDELQTRHNIKMRKLKRDAMPFHKKYEHHIGIFGATIAITSGFGLMILMLKKFD